MATLRYPYGNLVRSLKNWRNEAASCLVLWGLTALATASSQMHQLSPGLQHCCDAMQSGRGYAARCPGMLGDAQAEQRTIIQRR